MWIYVPSQFCPCAPESADSISALEWRSQMLVPSVLLRSKPMRQQSWQRAWNKTPWIKHLFGRIYEPSMARLGVDWLIASLRDTHASPLVLQENSSATKTPDTSGQMSFAWCEKSTRHSASSKMSPDIYDWDSNKSTMTFEAWVTALRQACSLRRKSVHLINGSDFSFWPTARVSSANGPCQSEISKGDPRRRLEVSVITWATPNTMDHLPPRSPAAMEQMLGPNGQRAGRTRPSNLREQILWPTPRAQKTSSENPETWQRRQQAGQVSTPPLAMAAAMWLTPRAQETEEKQETFLKRNGDRTGRCFGSLSAQVKSWPTVTTQDAKNNAGPSQFKRNTRPLNVEACLHSRSSPQGQQENGTASQKVLNPQFVEWLMGWPIGWTEFAPVETVSSRWLPLMHGALSFLEQKQQSMEKQADVE